MARDRMGQDVLTGLGPVDWVWMNIVLGPRSWLGFGLRFA